MHRPIQEPRSFPASLVLGVHVAGSPYVLPFPLRDQEQPAWGPRSTGMVQRDTSLG